MWKALQLAVLPALGLAVAGCSRPVDPGDLSVIVVTLDTTRADRIGAYGGDTVPTPVLDRLADQGVLFREAVSQVPLTLPSHSTMFTGRYPASHGVRHNGLFRLPESELTLAEIFKAAGFRTAGFIGAYVLNQGYGIAQGFDTYEDMESNVSSRKGEKAEFTADQVNAKVFSWLDTVDPGDRMFLWVHYYDPHSPYSPPEKPGRTLHGSGYDREISYIDACLGDLVRRLEQDGRLDKAVLVVAGDHGEGLGEHREQTHGIFLYQGTVRVPFILRAPGLLPHGRQVDGPVELVDLAPTVLELMNLDIPPPMQGRSLVQAIKDGKSGYRDAFSETLMPRLEFGWKELRMARDGRFKYIEAPRPELYDLRNDPGETENLADLQPERMAEMAALLQEHEQVTAGETSTEEAGHSLTPEEEEKLRSLGYLGGDFFKSGVAGGDLPDPKDRIDEGIEVWKARDYLKDGQLEEAEQILVRLLAENPRNQLARTTRLMVLLRLRNFDLAEEEALALLALTGEDPEAHAEVMDRSRHALAALHWIAGKKKSALEQYRVVRENRRQEGEQPMFQSLLLGAAGDRDEAEWLIAMMLQRNPLDGMALSARLELEHAAGDDEAALETAELIARAGEGDGFSLLRAAKMLNEAGKAASAAILFGIVAENSPPNPDLLGYLGTSRLSSGDLDGARDAFLEVMKLRPEDPRPPFYLGNIALLRNNERQARQYYDRSLEANADFIPPLLNLARWQAERGQVQDALKTVQDALRRRPGDREAIELRQLIQDKVKS